MSLSKYDCGCGQKTPSSRTFGNTGCCNHSVQAAPAPCCESHKTIIQHGVCLYLTCSIVTNADPFPLTFANTCGNNIPINSNEVFFYHASAGLMQIVGFDGLSYMVKLVDQSRVGTEIKATDCIMVSIETEASTASINTRCLSGNFTVPAINADAEIYILNGSGIPVGSTITFTANGETGSYLVKAFVSAAGNIYTYTVTNTGSGHTAGQTFSDCTGGCNIPIEVITDVDICDLAESITADTLTGCLNGSPRGVVPVGEGYVPVGTLQDDKLLWNQQKFTNLDCCVIFDGCLKFSGEACPNNTDSIVLNETGIECFEEAWNSANAVEQYLPVNIDGYNLLVTAYDSGTRTVTLTPSSNNDIDPPVDFCNGGQICLGDCCDSCTSGAQHTDHKEGEPNVANIGVDLGGAAVQLTAPAGTSYWLIGLDYATGAVSTLQVDAAYIASGAGSGPEFPRIEDPLVLRQKICNTAPQGCKQRTLLDFNYQIAFDPMLATTKIYWELGHFAQASATLEDGVTPNPFNIISTQAKTSGILQGPSVIEALLQPTSLVTGNVGNNKVYPFASGVLKDYIEMQKCDCAMSVVWLFIRIENGEAGEISLNSVTTVRRVMRKEYWNVIGNPANPNNQEGWNGL